ncbi:MAG: hypothetical protein JNJ96_13555 [Anaerolineales bacterium]|nr:hypothetical protein [Anaerolineales bacterium]
MGFYDIHYTHGQVEFGKDFIAKRDEEGTRFQYSFQAKVGDITQADWRNNIMGQMLEASMIGLSHPSFDKSLQHKPVLVTTGKLTGNVSISLQDLNETLQTKYSKLPIVLWDKEKLIEHLGKNGLMGLHNATATGFVAFGNFYVLYGNIINGKVDETELESHFAHWIKENIELKKKLLGSTLEAEILIQRFRVSGYLYESIMIRLCILRLLLREINYAGVSGKDFLLELYDQLNQILYKDCKQFMEIIIDSWLTSERNLVKLTNNSGNIITYPIYCARILEIAGFLYFLEEDPSERKNITDFIADFISREPGSLHIPSDNYAISLVLPILALARSNKTETAEAALRESVVWLINRYQDGLGLAPFKATAEEEVNFLLGYPFEAIKINSSNDSFLATTLIDLIASLNFSQLYLDTVNDIKAINLFPQYWQIPDTEALFCLDSEDIVNYPNIEFVEMPTDFSEFKYADHIMHEVRNYKILQTTRPITLFGLMLLLRDRYFPTIWRYLI